MAGNNRPICQLLTEMEEWMPSEVSNGCGGRELPAVSLLGPFLAVTVFAEEDPTVAEKFFSSEKQSQATIRALSSQLQKELDLLRVRMKCRFFKFLCRMFAEKLATYFCLKLRVFLVNIALPIFD